MPVVDVALDRLRTLLLGARNADGGWPYYAGRRSRIEPTSWALLAFSDAGAVTLLERWRASSGLLVEPEQPSVNYVFNALAALALGAQSAERAATAGRDLSSILLGHRGERVSEHPAIRQNPHLQGWSWTDGTFSWVEPTAWCMLAVKKLAREAPDAAARLDEGERVLRDRACAGGGWNYGNPEVFGKNLPAHVPPTAAALLALQDRAADAMVQEARSFLMREAAREGSTTALGISWLALSALKTPAETIAAQLAERLPVVESMPNLASAAMMFYVLDHHARQASPAALLL
jgi:hypothetical protein